MSAPARREQVRYLVGRGLSERRALAQRYKRYGVGMIYLKLRQAECSRTTSAWSGCTRKRSCRCDNGKEFCGKAMLEWAHARGVALRLIEPGKTEPVEL